jgi:amino acid adenylation domain-containing protein
MQASAEISNDFPTGNSQCPDDGSFVFPATLGQERFLLIQQLHPGTSSLNIALSHGLSGPLRVDILRSAVEEVARRHELLRASVQMIDGRPWNRIAPSITVDLPILDLSYLPSSERDDAAQRAIREDARVSFELSCGPLVRWRLLKLSPSDHILTTTLHHIICDGWSNGIYLHDLAAVYDALITGQPSPLAPLPLSYEDFALWQEAWLDSGEAQASVDFWKARIEKDIPVANFPVEQISSPEEDFPGDLETLLVPPGLATLVDKFCKSEFVTPFAIYMAAFQVLLHRYTGEEVFLVSSLAANRPQPELEGLVGLFVSPILIRADLSSGPSFRKVVAGVSEWTLDTYPHQALPFERIAAELDLKSGRQAGGLIQSSFVYQKAFMHSQLAGGVDFTPLRSVSPGTACNLMLSVVERAEGPRLQLEFNTKLYERRTVRRILSHFCVILGQGTTNPDLAVGLLPLVDGDEKQELIHAWAGEQADYPVDRPVHEWIEQQAESHPNRIAAECGGQEIALGELNRAANRLARRLVRLGAAPGTLVGICCQRGINLLVSAMGVMKAGGAYVPIDPAYPFDRIEAILDDTKAPLILTDGLAASCLPVGKGRLVNVDEEREAIDRESADNLGRTSTGNDLAYVIFTSGSTGRPKGVEITHRSFVNLLQTMSRRPGLHPEDRLVAVTTLSFDIAGLELFLPLVTGARVIIARQDETQDAQLLLALLKKSRANVLQATPTTWQLLLEAGWKGEPHLKMLCGGEAMSRELAKRLVKTGGELWNLYGPTETTIWSSALLVTECEGSVPLGTPVANTQFRVLDHNKRLVPVGIPGELYIAGDGVARGYFRQPALTAEKFVTDPFGRSPGARMYRTGDLVRISADGNLEFLGRLDHQVKVRGFRIELGEIETVLLAHAAVKEAVAHARTRDDGQQELYAWFTCHSGQQAPRVIELVQLLKSRLPPWMIPTGIVPMAAMPRTPNGKVDRLALPLPSRDTAVDTDEDYIGPRNAIELRTARIWEKVLDRPRISVNANFFDVGGYSLRIVLLFAEINREFHTMLPFTSIFRAPTIEKVSELLRATAGDELPSLVPVQPRGTQPPFFLIHSYMLYGRLPDVLGLDQPFFGMQQLDLDAHSASSWIDAMIIDHVRQIRRIQPEGPYRIAGWCFAGLMAYEVARRLELEGEQVSLLALLDSWCPYVAPTKSRTQNSDSRPARAKQLTTNLRYYLALHASKITEARGWEKLSYIWRTSKSRVKARWIPVRRKLFNIVFSWYWEHGLKLPKILQDVTMVTYFWLRNHYRPSPLKADITLFWPKDVAVPSGSDPACGWGGMTNGQIRKIRVPGTRSGMFLGENLVVLGERLRECLNGNAEAEIVTVGLSKDRHAGELGSSASSSELNDLLGSRREG